MISATLFDFVLKAIRHDKDAGQEGALSNLEMN
jgi:hypothetical protein